MFRGCCVRVLAAAEAFERAGQRSSKSKGKSKATPSGASLERAEGEWDSEEECYVVKKPVKKKPAKPRAAPKAKATKDAAGADGGVKRTAEQAFPAEAGGGASTSASVKAEEGAGAAAATAEEPYVPPAAAAAAGLSAFASGGLDDDYDEDSD